MGLDAVVFKSRARMEREFGRKEFNVDADTGEAIPTPESGLKVPLDAATAYSARIGNIDAVANLRALAGKTLATEDSIVLSKVLSSGSHSGDAVRPSDFPKLRAEIDLLASKGDPSLRDFVAAIRALLAAAEAEGNPIAFV